MSVITWAKTLTQDEILGIDDEADLIKILSKNHHKLNDTTNNIIQCTNEEVCHINHQNYPLIRKANGSQITKYCNEQEMKNLVEEDPEFPPMIATQGKQLGSVRYIWDGYVYARDGYTRSFRCSNRQLYKCPGRATVRDGEVVETKPHSHPREPQILQVEQVKEDMIVRARNEKSVALRTIYLEACKTEPLVRSHLGLDMMLSKMKKARSETPFSDSKPFVRPKKKLNFNFKWAKDWLEVPPGQIRVAFCNVCTKEIVLPTKIRVYNHYLSKMHKRAVLGLYRPPNKRFDIKKKNSSKIDANCTYEADSDHEDTYPIEVLDQFQDEVEHMQANKRIKTRKNTEYSSFYKEVIELQTNPGHQVGGENDFRISNGCQTKSTPEIKLPNRVSRSPTISVHVWDPNTGQPTSGLEISLYKEKDDVWSLVCRILTDERGKCCDLLIGKDLTTGIYKLNLDTRSYYSKRKQKCLCPYIEVRRIILEKKIKD